MSKMEDGTPEYQEESAQDKVPMAETTRKKKEKTKKKNGSKNH